MASDRRWSDFSTAQRTAIVAAGAVEVVLTTIAAADLVRRPSTQVRGPKALWWPVLAVQPAGPVAYLLWGRHR
ncbi:PLD nuclease N-terminal domain-containing protein [Jiangella muralis]|uniref:PLD nuclease N-terminal domain-containing protein n=1 Tax=Jiangella muralis TaxID=702383 RepID=UPI00069DC212|nr:PLD nuclease N-terminal domain-containing protein [Jiangella muralis]